MGTQQPLHKPSNSPPPTSVMYYLMKWPSLWGKAKEEEAKAQPVSRKVFIAFFGFHFLFLCLNLWYFVFISFLCISNFLQKLSFVRITDENEQVPLHLSASPMFFSIAQQERSRGINIHLHSSQQLYGFAQP